MAAVTAHEGYAEMQSKPKSLSPLLAWSVVYLLAVCVFWPGLNGGFLFDDFDNIVDNYALRIDRLTLQALGDSLSGPTAGPLGRPVSVLSFALTQYFFGLDPFAFKAINLAIHLVNGALVAWLVALLLQLRPRSGVPDDLTKWLPLWVAAAWLMHPINTVPVILAVQRMTLLSGLFTLLALIAHLKGASRGAGARARWLWLAAGWLVFWPLAVLSKETGLLFPLFVVLIARFAKATEGGAQLDSRGRGWIAPVSVLALLGIAVAMVSHLGLGWLEGAYAMRPFSPAERLLTEARVLWFYAAQIVLPVHTSFGLYLDDFPLSHGLLDPPTTALAVMGWVGVILGLAFAWRRWPLVSFAVLWFLAGHALESTLLPLEIAHEYRNYIPSIGLILGVGYLGATGLQHVRLDHRRLTVAATALLPILVLALFTWLRTEQWGDPVRGTQLEATHHPNSGRANYAAASALFVSGRGDADDSMGAQMIRYHFRKAAAVDPSSKLAHLGLIIWACASGRPVEEEWVEGLRERLQHTPYAPKDLELPISVLRPLVAMPRCLDRAQALGLLEAGSRNQQISFGLRAVFLDAATDYELLVSRDPVSARRYLRAAVATNPANRALKRKLEGFARIPGPNGDGAGAVPGG